MQVFKRIVEAPPGDAGLSGGVSVNERSARKGLALLLVPFVIMVAFSFAGQLTLQFAGTFLLYLGLPVVAGIVASRTSHAWLGWLALLIGWIPIVMLFWAMFNV